MPKPKGRQILYGVGQQKDLPIGKCYDYLCKIGIFWFDAMGIVGRSPIDEIRTACLTLKHNNVNVVYRHRELLKLLKGKEHEIWRK
jgi:hypothetical protein